MNEPVDNFKNAADGEARFIELHQEDVTVSVKRVTTAKVKIKSTTRVENAVIEQPLATESVEVTRLPVGQFVSELPTVKLVGETTIWPVFEEQYVLEKRIFLVEEVHIRNTRNVQSHNTAVTYRKQDVVVERIPLPLEQSTSETRKENLMNDDETIVAIYDSADAANNAASALREQGIPPANVNVHVAGTAAAAGTERVHKPEPGFWESLFGFSTDDTSTYDQVLANGSTVVSVKSAFGDTATVTDILNRFHPVDIDERGKSYSSVTSGASLTGGTAMGATSAYSTGTTGAGMGSATGTSMGDKLELAEESLVVGKRAVNMGTARVRRYVVETPVSEEVRLRDETVTIERRPVTDGRKVADADFTDKVIEMDETREEAVVSKTARVVEEVAINKQATERTETVRDTIKRDEVEITKAGETGSAAVGTTSTLAGTTKITPGD